MYQSIGSTFFRLTQGLYHDRVCVQPFIMLSQVRPCSHRAFPKEGIEERGAYVHISGTLSKSKIHHGGTHPGTVRDSLTKGGL